MLGPRFHTTGSQIVLEMDVSCTYLFVIFRKAFYSYCRTVDSCIKCSRGVLLYAMNVFFFEGSFMSRKTNFEAYCLKKVLIGYDSKLTTK